MLIMVILQMSSSRKVVEFFYDVVSPYSWLAFEVLCRYKNVWNIDLKYKPAFLGGFFFFLGNIEPGSVDNKQRYLLADLKLISEYYGVPLNPPPVFNKETLLEMRFVTAIAEKNQEENVLLEKVSRELWKRAWQNNLDNTQPPSLIEAGLQAGLSANEVEELLTNAKSQPIKDKLKSVTQEALEKNAFGLPFIVCHVNGKVEVFFGCDRFELIAHRIGEKWAGPCPIKTTM
ncbi:glutathione S-transferase kappa 1-like isoform X3 [Danio rerio]|uniref:Glutathione S-transferase kappa 1-like isoform X3 n=1 Tax=Danio rerio TaxID=7955 RepID=A0AC58HJU7_DANRE